jgi:uncharacterized protein YecE (DUF72 family)
MALRIGTSGFSYEDWKGHFYPKTLAKKEMLSFYSQHFPVCEINSTYYRIPIPRNMEAMVAKTQGKMDFVIKVHQSMTHLRNATDSEYRAFKAALQPFRDSGVLGALLVQFPYSFPNNLDNRGYLADIKEKLGKADPVVVEFRHRSWAHPEVLEFLKKCELGVVNVDEPDMHGLVPANDAVTGTVGYVRFHGRNRENWYKTGAQPWERYDYLYSLEELQEWVPRINKMNKQADTTYVFFNNHWQSQAVTNAQQMAELLKTDLSKAVKKEVQQTDLL